MLLFKVLTDDGTPAHGGTGKYALPTSKPGRWMPLIENPSACSRGYHLTSNPAAWWTEKARLFLAEYRGAVSFAPPNKIACAQVRLVEEITPEWPLLPIYPALRALLISSWRQRHPKVAKLPAWAHLSGADLSGANLSRADLSGADLSRADLSGANLSRADLSRADLSGADLSRAYLYGPDLSGANLYGADLSGANLFRADLSGANLSRAYNVPTLNGWKVGESGIVTRV